MKKTRKADVANKRRVLFPQIARLLGWQETTNKSCDEFLATELELAPSWVSKVRQGGRQFSNEKVALLKEKLGSKAEHLDLNSLKSKRKSLKKATAKRAAATTVDATHAPEPSAPSIRTAAPRQPSAPKQAAPKARPRTHVDSAGIRTDYAVVNVDTAEGPRQAILVPKGATIQTRSNDQTITVTITRE